MIVVVTPIYAAVLGLLFAYLSVRVIGARRQARVALGDGGDRALLRRQRVQGNFAEYVPLTLVLMTLAELQGGPGLLLHGIGLALLAGRTVHAIGVSRDPEPFRLRVAGMALTFAALFTGAIANLGLAAI